MSLIHNMYEVYLRVTCLQLYVECQR